MATSIHDFEVDGRPKCWDWDLKKVVHISDMFISPLILLIIHNNIQVQRYVQKREKDFIRHSNDSKRNDEVRKVAKMIEYCLFVSKHRPFHCSLIQQVRQICEEGICTRGCNRNKKLGYFQQRCPCFSSALHKIPCLRHIFRTR